MAIKITSLRPDSLVEDALSKNYLYKDLKLDMEFDVFYSKQLNKKESLKDVAAIYDVEAVKNSVITAFLTSPGDKILNPEYGLDLRRYLFEPIDDFIIDIITDDIKKKLPLVEPRVTVENVWVDGDEDNNTISISLQINIPSLNVYGVSLKTELNSSGYSIP